MASMVMRRCLIDALSVSAAFTVTSDRKESVDFVNPYDYSTGSSMFVNAATQNDSAALAAAGWAGTEGKSLCTFVGDDAITSLENYGMIWVQVDTADQADANMTAGKCRGSG
jgi:ABC-type amino acid transport substrate-binding protein